MIDYARSRIPIRCLSIALTCFLSGGFQAVLVIPGADGSDGSLMITNSVMIDLSLASTGNWDDDNSTNAGIGNGEMMSTHQFRKTLQP